MSRANCSFPFSLSNVGYISTFDSENGELEADVTFGPPITKRDEADQ